MTNTLTCPHGFACWLACTSVLLIWWFVQSALIHVTWNKVIGSLFKVKASKYWHALLLVATLSFLCFPRVYMRGMHGMCGKCGMESSCCHSKCHHEAGEKEGTEEGDDCPYSRHKDKAQEKPNS